MSKLYLGLMVIALNLALINAANTSNSTIDFHGSQRAGQNIISKSDHSVLVQTETRQGQQSEAQPEVVKPTIGKTISRRKSIVASKKDARMGKLSKPKLNKKNNSTSPSLPEPVPVNSTNINVNETMLITGNSTDQHASASLLRPLLFRGLLTGRRLTGGGLLGGGLSSLPEEEEEEVTKTIMMPMSEAEQEQHQNEQAQQPTGRQSTTQTIMADPEQEVEQVVTPSIEEVEGQPADESIPLKETNMKADELVEEIRESVYPLAEQGATRAATTSTKIEEPPTRVPKLDEHPKPEESLQLSRTELNNLMLDGEGPESYRERERHGEGVLVGEEPAPAISSSPDSHQLGTAASTGFDSHHRYGQQHTPMSSYPAGGPAIEGDGFGTGRLSPEASEGFGTGGGFSHRFGHSSSYDDHSGRLMQSPNEYSEYNGGHGAEAHGYSSGFSSPGGHHGGHSPHHDYSPHSGLVRASSGEHFGGHSGSMSPESAHYDHFHSHGHHAGGYHGSGRLEQHPSEHYGGEHHYHPQGEDSPHSHHGGYHSPASYNDGGRLTAAGSHGGGYHPHPEAHYSGYNDHYGGRAFGGYERRGFASQQNEITMRNTDDPTQVEPAKLMPLSPNIPTPDEVPAASSSPETTDNKGSMLRQGATSDREEQEPPAGERPSTRDQEDSSQQAGESATPEPEEQQSSQEPRQPVTYESAVRQVEFARIGSAGFLAPSMAPAMVERHSRLVDRDQRVEADRRHRELQQREQQELRRHHQRQQQVAGQRQSRQPYDPADNPAHAGKYIID